MSRKRLDPDLLQVMQQMRLAGKAFWGLDPRAEERHARLAREAANRVQLRLKPAKPPVSRAKRAKK